jgi:hypothetical protein
MVKNICRRKLFLPLSCTKNSIGKVQKIKQTAMFHNVNSGTCAYLSWFCISLIISSPIGSVCGRSPRSLCWSKSPCIWLNACSPTVTEVSSCEERSTDSSPIKNNLFLIHTMSSTSINGLISSRF